MRFIKFDKRGKDSLCVLLLLNVGMVFIQCRLGVKSKVSERTNQPVLDEKNQEEDLQAKNKDLESSFSERTNQPVLDEKNQEEDLQAKNKDLESSFSERTNQPVLDEKNQEEDLQAKNNWNNFLYPSLDNNEHPCPSAPPADLEPTDLPSSYDSVMQDVNNSERNSRVVNQLEEEKEGRK